MWASPGQPRCIHFYPTPSFLLPWILGGVLGCAAGVHREPRYLLPAMPALAVLAALGLGLASLKFAVEVDPRVEEIEADLERVIRQSLELDDAALQWRCEQTIRNYDPCISCATHYLKVKIER